MNRRSSDEAGDEDHGITGCSRCRQKRTTAAGRILPLDFGSANGRFSASRPWSGRASVENRCPPRPDLQVRVFIVKFYPLDPECGPLLPWRTRRPCIARRAEIGLDLQKHREYGVAQSYPLRSYSLLRSTANRGRKTVRLLRRSIDNRESGFAPREAFC